MLNSYLELALEGQLDSETRDNLRRSHTASKVSRSLTQDIMQESTEMNFELS
jgi:hypothetical protein